MTTDIDNRSFIIEFLFEEIQDLDFIRDIDVLIDGKFILSLLDHTLHWKGSSNQRVIDVKKTLEKKQIILHNT